MKIVLIVCLCFVISNFAWTQEQQNPCPILERLTKLEKELQQVKQEKQALENLVKEQGQMIVTLQQENISCKQSIYYSSGYTLPEKICIGVGEEKEITVPHHLLMGAPFRYVLWVNVDGAVDSPTKTTEIEISRHVISHDRWDKDITGWIIKSRNWGDNYIDQNISRVSNAAGFWYRNLKIKNRGPQACEIFAIGVISETRIAEATTDVGKVYIQK